MGTTQRMARFIAEAKYEQIPTPAVNLAKLCLLDAVGCAVYGTTRPLGRIMTRWTQPSMQSWISTRRGMYAASSIR